MQFARQLLDDGSWTCWDTPPRGNPTHGPYADDLARARERSGGADEAVLTGEGRIHGRRIAVIVGEFGFLAGSVGVAAADRLLRAVDRATAEGLPLLACPATGGTRMQEGTPAFVGMVPIVSALAAHKAAGLPYLVHLRHPTTGGVLASWGSLGHTTTAEPRALVGFLGPRVYQALYGREFPEGVQTAENLDHHGIVDAVLTTDQLRARTGDILRILTPGTAETPAEPSAEASAGTHADQPSDQPAEDVWQSVTLTRAADRPGLADLLATADSLVPLHGTGAGERDDTLTLALARFDATPCVVIGHDRAQARQHGTEITPAGLRTAQRGMRLAAELGLPLLTVIDTAGAQLGPEHEEAALAGEIARSLQQLVTLPVPTLSLLLGQGTGGAALALLPADRVLATQHAWLAPLPPEGASAILHRTTDRAADLARAQHIGAHDLLRAGTVDRIVAEPDTPSALIRAVSAAVSGELAALRARSGPVAGSADAVVRLAEQRGRRSAALVRLDDEV
ncbi:acetyl-CoA carboxylase carboxyltransferase subunit alpha/beta [Streptacidiphilus sp. NEAU-YB345]|uniref:Acetyl-CoA carboxylase carboxyltransferase subunit alpha/beta n=1 Tax=Streptacidiphilus fuscans TaxID=2789292 RepID=A0A931B1P1_9ACTN|nr:acetyl-CoA carboxylase carboxyltransferase subunit alpha/beta [Streptacidiphilus fuscans]